MAKLDNSSFSLRLYAGAKTTGDAEFESIIPYIKREEYRTLYLPGFDGRITIQLNDLWLQFENEELTTLTQEVTGYETIVKFSTTMQVENRYTAILEIC